MSVDLSAQDRIQGYAFCFSHQPAIRVAEETMLTPDQKGVLIGMTVMNVLGYIPGVSLIVGIARILFAQLSKAFAATGEMEECELKQARAIQEAQLARGALECCSIFAPLMVITDVSMTILMKSGI